MTTTTHTYTVEFDKDSGFWIILKDGRGKAFWNGSEESAKEYAAELKAIDEKEAA